MSGWALPARFPVQPLGNQLTQCQRQAWVFMGKCRRVGSRSYRPCPNVLMWVIGRFLCRDDYACSRPLWLTSHHDPVGVHGHAA
jgi:hypothetical protein